MTPLDVAALCLSVFFVVSVVVFSVGTMMIKYGEKNGESDHRVQDGTSGPVSKK